jgi:hypothetical protein
MLQVQFNYNEDILDQSIIQKVTYKKYIYIFL